MRLLARRPAERSAAKATPWRQAAWCVVDLELTGLDPREDEIIAIGAVPVEGGRVILGRAFYTLVRTDKRSERQAVLMHKLRVPDLAQAPGAGQAIDALRGVLAGRVPVFHTAHVEQSFLAARGVRVPAAADTEALGRLWLRSREGEAPARLPLGALAQRLGQPAEPRHHALGDALTTAQVFIALATLLERDGDRQTVGSLVFAGDGLRGPRRFGAT